jgi:hypothetical protein
MEARLFEPSDLEVAELVAALCGAGIGHGVGPQVSLAIAPTPNGDLSVRLRALPKQSLRSDGTS